jgi:hypothetical protein
MKIVLLVPDGVAVRNYIYSDFIKELHQAHFEIILYHQIPEQAIQEIQNIQGNRISQFHVIPGFKESVLARVIRESCSYARIKYNAKVLQNKTISKFWNGKSTNIKRFLLLRIAELIGSIISKKYSFILKFEKWYDLLISKNSITKSLETDLSKLQPDYILNLHQRSVNTAPIIAAATNLKIKTGTVIFSWDNVPKARLISRYDTYFVWSDLMKTELNTLYKEIQDSSIQIVGTPQFEFYFNNNFQIIKEDFFKVYNLNPNKKTVCYSANDAASPYEANYLEDLCEEISKIDEVNRPQILFRRCPVDFSNRFDNVINAYPNLLFPVNPDWRIASADQKAFIEIFPGFSDISLLVNTVLHSDVVVNLGSTMAHDFAVNNKPCLYLNYDPVESSLFKVSDVFAFQHFRSMESLDAVGWINSKAVIINKVEQALDRPESIGSDRLKWLQKVVRHPLENNSRILANEIINLCTSV